MALPPETGTKKKSGGSSRPPSKTISNLDQLKKVYPNFKSASMNQLLLELTNTGYTISPQFWKTLQDFMLQAEAANQQPVAGLAQLPGIFPAAARGDITPPNADKAGGGRSAGGGGGGGGGGAAAMSAEEEFYWWKQQQDYEAQQRAQAEADQRAYEAEQQRIQREWEAQQAEIARQNQLRLQRLGDLTQLVGQFAGIQARARETLAGLQGDPFKFASAKMGLASQGTTPMQSFRGELGAFAGQPMPTIDPNAPLSAIEQQIMGLQGQMAPQAPRIFGMGGGGEVHGQEQTVLVGELGKPEIVVGTDFKVIPLSGTGGAGYDTSSLLPALAPLYAGMNLGGFGGDRWRTVPLAGRHGQEGFATDMGANVGALGYSPRLLRDATSGRTLYRNDTGQLQHIKSPADFGWFGFNWGDVLNVTPEQLAQFGPEGPSMSTRPPVPTTMPSAFGPLSSPIIEPVTGAILPAPYRAAAFLNQMRLQNPQLYQLALSAYANSMSRPGDPTSALGYTQEGVEAEVRQALPFGQEHGLIGLR